MYICWCNTAHFNSKDTSQNSNNHAVLCPDCFQLWRLTKVSHWLFLSQIGAHFPGADRVAEQSYKVSNKLLRLFLLRSQKKKSLVFKEQ